MPPSMRAQTIANKRQINIRKEEQARRAKVFSLLQQVRLNMGQTGYSRDKNKICKIASFSMKWVLSQSLCAKCSTFQVHSSPHMLLQSQSDSTIEFLNFELSRLPPFLPAKLYFRSVTARTVLQSEHSDLITHDPDSRCRDSRSPVQPESNDSPQNFI